MNNDKEKTLIHHTVQIMRGLRSFLLIAYGEHSAGVIYSRFVSGTLLIAGEPDRATGITG